MLRGKCIVLFILGSGCLISCIPNNEDRCDSDFYWEGTGCHKKDTGTAENNEADDPFSDLEGDASIEIDPEQWIGSSCSCQGEECLTMGAPVPGAGEIVDCDDVPSNWPGATKVCFRSYAGGLAPERHYANGYCSLMAAACEGSSLICSMIALGDYNAMTTCPPDAVLVTFQEPLDLSGQSAVIDTKLCVAPCDDNDECRPDETDPLFNNAPSGYQCLEADGQQFCYDPRNLAEGYQAELF